MPAPDTDLSASRYGTRRRLSRRTWAIVSAVGITLGVVAAWYVSDYQTSNSFQSDVLRFDVQSDHEIEVTIRVRPPEDAPSECDMSAQAADHTYVGETTFSLSAPEDGVAVVTDVIATERRAVTATITTCRLVN